MTQETTQQAKTDYITARVSPRMREAIQKAATIELRDESNMIRVLLHEGLTRRGLMKSRETEVTS